MNIKYGTSRAASVLAEIVAEHPHSEKISRKVARTINQFNIRANDLESSGMSTGSIIVLYELLVRDYINRCEDIFCFNIDDKVRTFIQNIINAKYKAWLDDNLANYTLNTKR